ncbi:MAG TPA: hypothetical protein V6C81_23045 [Planktothrix sp.]
MVDAEPEKYNSAQPPRWQVFLSLLLLPYFGLLIISQFPHEFSIRKRYYEPVRMYLTMIGINQYWGMFAPDLGKLNTHTTCILTLQDGTKSYWLANSLDDPDRYQLERWNKLITENSLSPFFHEMLPYLGRWVGRKLQYQTDPPLQLTYSQWVGEIPPPSEPPLPRANVPAQTKFSTWFVYRF